LAEQLFNKFQVETEIKQPNCRQNVKRRFCHCATLVSSQSQSHHLLGRVPCGRQHVDRATPSTSSARRYRSKYPVQWMKFLLSVSGIGIQCLKE